MEIDPTRRGVGSNQVRGAQGGRFAGHEATVGGEGLARVPKDNPLYRGGKIDFHGTAENASFSKETGTAQRFGWLITQRRW